MKTSARLLRVRPSLTLAIDGKAKQYRTEGRDVIGFAAGEPDFAPPPEVERAAIAAISEKRGRYSAVAGLLELRRAIGVSLRSGTGLDYGADQIVVTSGAKQAIYNALYVLCDDGDEVLIPAPYWTSYPEMARSLALEPVICPTTSDGGLDVAAIAARITPRTRALILNSPSNPSGVVFKREELAALADVLRPESIWILSDDIYGRLVYSGRSFVNLPMVAPDLIDRTVLIDGMSKTYCMTGWRVGFAAGPKAIIDQIATIQSHSTSCVNTIAQHASVVALQAVGPEQIAAMVTEYERRADRLVAALRTIEGVTCRSPDAAFYAYPDVSARLGASHRGRRIDSSLDLADQLLETELVATVPGEAFGTPGFLRLSFATSYSEVERGIERLVRFFADLD